MKKYRFLWVVLALGLLIRMFKVHLVYCIAPDGIAYINAAKDLISGKGFNSTWPPLYPFFLSIFWNLISNPELSGQLVSVLFGVLTIGIVYIMFKNIFNEQVGIITSLFAAFHPYLVRYSAETLADSLFTFLITTVVFLGWLSISKKKIYHVVLTGFFAALAYLAKPEGVVLLVVISIWWLFEPKRKWITKISRMLFAWFIFLIICFPYLYSIQRDTGKWMISQKQSIVFSIALKNEGYTEEFLDISPAEYLKTNPKIFFKKIGSGFLKLLGRFPDAYNPFLFLLFIFGLINKYKDKQFLYFIASFLILFFMGYAMFHPGRRYLVGWVPVTLFVAGFGVENLNDWLKKINVLKTININYTGLIVGIIILAMLPKTFEYIRPEAEQWKEAGFWIKRHFTGTPKVMCDSARVIFYSEGEYVPLDESKFNAVDYIVTEKEISFLKKAFSLSTGLNIYYGEK
jgi:4-amino-4-deoxy-L-arabinose transferase-like glycosyltransferase